MVNYYNLTGGSSEIVSDVDLAMKKMYHLGNCTTCQAIITETGILKRL